MSTGNWMPPTISELGRGPQPSDEITVVVNNLISADEILLHTRHLTLSNCKTMNLCSPKLSDWTELKHILETPSLPISCRIHHWTSTNFLFFTLNSNHQSPIGIPIQSPIGIQSFNTEKDTFLLSFFPSAFYVSWFESLLSHSISVISNFHISKSPKPWYKAKIFLERKDMIIFSR